MRFRSNTQKSASLLGSPNLTTCRGRRSFRIADLGQATATTTEEEENTMHRRMSSFREYKFFRSFSAKIENWHIRKAESLWKRMRERKLAGTRFYASNAPRSMTLPRVVSLARRRCDSTSTSKTQAHPNLINIPSFTLEKHNSFSIHTKHIKLFIHHHRHLDVCCVLL